MAGRVLFIIVIWGAALWPAAAESHPMPFTYLDLRLQQDGIDVSLVAHLFDVSHDLAISDPSLLMNPQVVGDRRRDILDLFAARLTLAGRAVQWTDVQLLPERQSVRVVGRVDFASGALPLSAHLFPYDPAHQTFVNVYESGGLTLQAILDASKTELVYFPGSRQGILALMRRFVPDGASHILGGAEHWLFLAGLLLLGASTGQLVRILAAFVAADTLTTTLLMLNVVHPEAQLTDPALALAVVYVGADNLMIHGGRDVRPWIALGFGVLHGFWFGGGLALMDLPRSALGWSLLAFDIGSIAAQTGILIAGAWIVRTLHRRGGASARRLTVAGSIVVIAGGIVLFTQRVFFPTGMF